MTNLPAIIEDEIARKGAISFARFMELALYCPNFGYYERPDRTPGRKGDFYTSVSVGNLFGELLAWRFAAWLEAVSGGKRQIVEAGAHDGRLARDILSWLQKNRPEVLASTEYWILEPSAFRMQTQKSMLEEFIGHVRWFSDWHAVPPGGVTGIIFANELLDAMPVHRIGWDAANKEWFEWRVGLAENQFVWERNQAAVPKVQIPELPPELLAVLPDGFTTEVCPAATDWWRRAAGALRRGRLLTFDYGLTAEEFFTPRRRAGTLRAYRAHRQTDALLADPGEQDMTAQVNFTAIREAGEAAGLITESFASQAQFLTAIVESESKVSPGFEEWFGRYARQFQTLTHPQHLGESFRVLTQSRDPE